jgi:hypothetical protein
MRPKMASDWTDGTTGEWRVPFDAPQAHRSPLTIRTVDEILTMTFDDADLILKNGYLSRGERSAICGMGGVGKSRLSMQLACCCRAGRDFLGWPTNGRDLRFLFLQTENSCRRLKADLEKMLSAFTPEEQKHTKAGLFFHTLENDDDGFLMLDIENLARVAAAITENEAEVIVYDPLRDFSLDDLNSDKFMGDTLRQITRVTKRGNPKRTALVIHHAATGKAGVQKTTGFDRSSFGRNSKVLFAWTRAQINVAPAKGEDNSVIIVASGKCNDALEFEPFAARLNFETMHYERDDDFDVEQWHQRIAAAATRPTYGSEIVRDLIWPTDEQKAYKHLVKKKLASLVMDASGCGRTKAYELIDLAQKKGFVRFSKLSQSYEKLDTEQAASSRGLRGSVRRPSGKNPRG